MGRKPRKRRRAAPAAAPLFDEAGLRRFVEANHGNPDRIVPVVYRVATRGETASSSSSSSSSSCSCSCFLFSAMIAPPVPPSSLFASDSSLPVPLQGGPGSLGRTLSASSAASPLFSFFYSSGRRFLLFLSLYPSPLLPLSLLSVPLSSSGVLSLCRCLCSVALSFFCLFSLAPH